MKKRLLSIVLTAVLCLGLLPTAAFAEDEGTIEIWLGGVKVTEENCGDLTAAINEEAGSDVASGTASYNAETRTLTLEDFSYEGAGYCFDTQDNEYAALYAKGNDKAISALLTSQISPLPALLCP